MKKLIFMSVVIFVLSFVFTNNYMGGNNSLSLCVNGTVYYQGNGYEGATVSCNPDWKWESTCHLFYFNGVSDSGNEDLDITKSACISK